MSGRAQSGSTGAPQSRVIDMLPNSPADKSADTSIQPTTAPEPSKPQEPKQKSTPDAMSRMAQSLSNQTRRVQGIDQGPAPSIRGTVTDLDAYRRAQAAVTNKKFNPMIKAMVDKGVFDKTGTDDRLNEFAPGQSGGSGNYFQALASAWYNGAFDTGSLQKGIKSKEDVERLLNRGIVAPDGKIRKYAIDYNSDFDGVVISSDDYYEHADYNDQGQEVDSRTGQKWGPYDYMEFGDSELDEGLLGFISNKKSEPTKKSEPVDPMVAKIVSNRQNPQSRVPGAKAKVYHGYDEYNRAKAVGDVEESTVNELSTDKLAQYKTAAALDAGAADKRGDYERGDKRFAGIIKATKKQFANDLKKHGQQSMAEATGDEKFDTMMSQMQREPKYPDSQMPPTDVKDLYQWAVKNNKPYHKIFANWANREGYKSVAPALQKAGNLDTEALDYWTPDVWKIYWAEVRGIDWEMPPEWAKKRVPDELRDYLETVFDAYDRIVFDWPTEYRQIGEQGMAEGSEEYCDACDRVITKKPHVCLGSQGVAEGSSTASDAVERAILNRIMVQHTDLLMRFGPDKVMQAAEEVAYNVGDVDEIGTSDVSAYVNQVKQILGA